MIGWGYALLKPLLLRFDPERAHDLTLRWLKAIPLCGQADSSRLAVSAFGLTFPNPIGLAAGFDKNAEVVDPMLRLGFGFVEVGTVTPRPQAGNPRPRLFRSTDDRAVINRLGFNNDGNRAVLARLEARRGNGIVGVNLGANKESEDKAADYVAGIRVFAQVASYFTLNVSSPNTPGLRDLQKKQALDALIARVIEARDETALRHPGAFSSEVGTGSREENAIKQKERDAQRFNQNLKRYRRPVLLKIAPDLTLAELDDIIEIALTRGLDGMIVSNTTITRPSTLKTRSFAAEAGGLSGAPLFDLSTAMLAETAKRVAGRFPLIGVGGIHSPETARAKFEAGASLIQLYSGLVFEGPDLVTRIKRGLAQTRRDEGHDRPR